MKLSQLKQIIREEAKRASNEEAILNNINPSLEGEVKVAVGALEKLLQSTEAVLDYEQIAYRIIDIIDAAKQEARDEYKD